MEKTAINQLVEELKEMAKCRGTYNINDAITLAKSYLEKERKQIIDSYERGADDEYYRDHVGGDKYYNSTFNNI